MIFFFSGTGNTRFIATQLAQATGDRLIGIASAVLNDQYDYVL